jgi:UDP-N-acetylmuramate dehydrogenase
MEQIYELLSKAIPKERIRINEPMSEHTSFNIGGPADLFVTVMDEEELATVLRLACENNAHHLIIGNGSNFLVSDKGYRGIIVKLGDAFSDISVEGNEITVGAGKLLSGVSAFACRNGLAGLEFASGIPGTIGGAIFMNAGAYGGEMKDIVRSARLMSADGSQVKELSKDELGLEYRHSIIQETGDIVLSVVLGLEPDDSEAISARIAELSARRNAKQPVQYPSAGSTFKRPVGGYAAALIESAGLKGYTIGGAKVSEKHSGFIINTGGATCKDVLELMKYVQQKVYENSGIMLEPEVRIIGEIL